MFSDDEYFFSPADGIIIYQREVRPTDCIVDIEGCTTFIVTRNADTIQLADRVLFLESGRLAGDGTHEVLYAANELPGAVGGRRPRAAGAGDGDAGGGQRRWRIEVEGQSSFAMMIARKHPPLLALVPRKRWPSCIYDKG